MILVISPIYYRAVKINILIGILILGFGNLIMNVVPLFTLLSTLIVPPCSFDYHFTDK